MIALLQRVAAANVVVSDQRIAEIGPGLLVLVAVEPGDGERTIERMAERLLTYRVFSDSDGKMNRSLLDDGLELLLVPQFTLAADTKKGTRPSFARAAPPDVGKRYFQALLERCRQRLPATKCGEFAAHMQVSLTNDGPVTFWLQVA
ncbi:MAG: D-aminoacyl-tRNA deacylase [Pseudomonadota bacterium]